MKKITWKTEKRKISDLLPWDRNPRKLSEEQAENLEKSLEKFGVVEPPAINTDNTIIGGHQRSKVLSLMKGYGGETEIDVRVPSRKLTEREVEELNVRLNKNTGSFDFDALADSFNVDDLMEWGFKSFELGLPGEDIDYDEIWKGMPEFEQNDARPWKVLNIQFANEEDLVAFSKLIGQNLTPKTKAVWYPFKEKQVLEIYGYIDES